MSDLPRSAKPGEYPASLPPLWLSSKPIFDCLVPTDDVPRGTCFQPFHVEQSAPLYALTRYNQIAFPQYGQSTSPSPTKRAASVRPRLP